MTRPSSGSGERTFSLLETRVPYKELDAGLAVGSRAVASAAPRARALHRWQWSGWLYEFLEVPRPSLVDYAREQVRASHAQIVTLHLGGSTSTLAIATAFASHLYEIRVQHRGSPCLTSAEPPLTDLSDLVTVPHLVRAAMDEITFVDVVVWELTPREIFVEWFGGNEADLAYFGEHLSDLFEIRSQLRTGSLPNLSPCAALLERLRGKYLSMRFALLNASLVRDVIEELPTGR